MNYFEENPSRLSSWIVEFKAMQSRIHGINKQKGFWDTPRNQGESIALMHSELSEALEAIRKNNPPDEHCPGFSSLEIELADTIIRIMDFAEGFELDLALAIVAKISYNLMRPHKHGKEF